jgi:CHAD domain-containing protein
VIGSDAFRQFVIDCAVWIEAGTWTAGADTLAGERARRPVTIHAAEQMSTRRKKCRKLGPTIDHLDPGQLHVLRIRVKKLRYTAEFFESLYTDHRPYKACNKFLAETRNLQDALGGLNDVTTRRALFADLMTRKERATARLGSRQRAFAAGLIVGHQESQVAQLTKRAIKAFSKLEKVKPFWKVSAALPLQLIHDGLAANAEMRVLEKSPGIA